MRDPQLRALLEASSLPTGADVSIIYPRPNLLHLLNVTVMSSDFDETIAWEDYDDLYKTLAVIPVEINGVELTAIVDTGSSSSLISYRGFSKTGLIPLRDPREREAKLVSAPTMTFSGMDEMYLSIAKEVRLGAGRIRNLPLHIVRRLPLPKPLIQIGGVRIDLILGQDLLSRFSQVTFDASKREISVRGVMSALPQTSIMGSAIPIESEHAGIPIFPAVINSKGPISTMFDSGGSFGLWMSQTTAEGAGLQSIAMPAELRVAKKMFKPSTSRPVDNSTIVAGELTLHGVPTFIGMVQGGDVQLPFAILGNYVLQEYVVTIDRQAKQLIFSKPK